MQEKPDLKNLTEQELLNMQGQISPTIEEEKIKEEENLKKLVAEREFLLNKKNKGGSEIDQEFEILLNNLQSENRAEDPRPLKDITPKLGLPRKMQEQLKKQGFSQSEWESLSLGEIIEVLENKTNNNEFQKKEKNIDNKDKTAVDEKSVDLEKDKSKGNTEEESSPEEKEKRVHKYGKSEVLDNLAQYESAEAKKKQDYLEAYQKEVRGKGLISRNLMRFGDWLGVKSKDTSINKDLGEIAESYNKSILKQEFVRARLQEREEKMREAGKSETEIQEYMQRVGKRYSTFIVAAHKLEKNYKDISAVKREIWGNPKSQLLESISNGAKKLWETKAIKNSIGNKWVRFALGGGIAAALTGGFSGVFLMNRSARFLGGMVGGKITQKLLTRYRNEEKIYTKKLETLTKKYKDGEVKAENYGEERNEIERRLTAIRRQNQALVAAAAYGAGMGAGKLSETFNPLDHSGAHHDGTDKEGKVPENKVDPAVETDETNTTPETHKIHEGAHIGKGEGQEHAFRRIIEEDQGVAKALGYEEWSHKQGLAVDYSEEHLHKFSAGAAHRFAISEGLYDQATGQERWIYENGHDVAYDMQVEPDGSVTVHEYVDSVETDIPDSANDSFETDKDYAGDGKGGKFVYEKTHGGNNSIEHRGTLHGHSKIDAVPYDDTQDFKVTFSKDTIDPVPYEDESVIKIVDGANTITKVDGPTGNTIPKVDGPDGQVISEAKPILGKSSNYDYVQRPGIFNNVEVDPYDQGVNTHRGPGTRGGVYGNQPRTQGGGFLGDLLKIFGL